jgi:hypothetical protein
MACRSILRRVLISYNTRYAGISIYVQDSASACQMTSGTCSWAGMLLYACFQGAAAALVSSEKARRKDRNVCGTFLDTLSYKRILQDGHQLVTGNAWKGGIL